MPELPEVETIRRQVHPQLESRQLVCGWGHFSPKFTDAVTAVGATVERLRRRGKYLIADLDDDRELVIHLGMTGSVRVVPARDARADPHLDDPYVRAWWGLDDGATVIFRDVRRFGRIAVVDAGRYETLPTLAHLGPEPFDPAFDAATLWTSVRGSSRHLKTDLLSQRHVAGVGNIYADEALWLAGLNPADRSITLPRARRLVPALREALASGLEHGGPTLRDYVDGDGRSGSNQHHLHCYGRADLPCERCGTSLRATRLDARTTTWCPTCQPRRR